MKLRSLFGGWFGRSKRATPPPEPPISSADELFRRMADADYAYLDEPPHDDRDKPRQ